MALGAGSAEGVGPDANPAPPEGGHENNTDASPKCFRENYEENLIVRLNGWWRLWIVLSLLYMGWALLFWLEPYPSPERFLANAEAFAIKVPGDSAFRASMLALAATQSAPDQLQQYRKGWWITASYVLLAWPAIVGIAFLLAAWIRGGFTRRRRGVRVIEAEIED